MLQNIHDCLASVAGKSAWEKGLRSFHDGAVLDIHQTGKVLEARVANSNGRFERAQIRFKKDSLQSRCTCAWKITPFCEHAVASLLQYSKEHPDVLKMLAAMAAREKALADNAAKKDEMPAPAAASQVRIACPSQPKTHSLRTLLAQVGPSGRVEVNITGGPPHLDSRWGRVELRVDLVCENRKYSSSNMKRLVEIGSAAGGMRLTEFALQEQQLMRFLLAQAEIVGTRFVLGSHDASDLFHCMVNSPSLFCDSGRVAVHAQTAELILTTQQEGKRFLVTPRFRLPEHGLLPAAALKTVVGRGGVWLGVGADYWWLPGICDMTWVRCFLSSEPVLLSAEDLSRLSLACEEHRLPARLLPSDDTIELHAVTGQCSPVFTLDWNSLGLVGKLEFEYGGKRVDSNGPDILWEKKRFISRDGKAETGAVEHIKALGFSRYTGRKDTFILREPEKLWNILQDGLQGFDDSWQVYYSGRFNRNRDASGMLQMHLNTAAEGRNWFELDCRLETETGEVLSVDDLVAALHKSQEFVKLASGAVAGIPPDLRRSLEIMLGRAESRDASTLRFGNFAAVPVDLAAAAFYKNGEAAWQKVCQRLKAPLSYAELQLPKRLDHVLRDYQREGVSWLVLLEECGFHGILADEMGLGKTIQALAALVRRKQLNKTDKPSLVVCPTSLVDNWLVEATRFAPELHTVIIEGSHRKQVIARLDKVDLAITSYALLRRDIDRYAEQEFDYVILDEAQHIKNPETVNAKTCKALQSSHRLILTGTPVENALHELWSLFDFLLPGMLGSRKQFREEYELPAANGGLHAASQELAAQIRPFIMRRTKKEVSSQLPPKIEQVVYCELQGRQRQLYADIMNAGSELLQRARQEGFNKTRFEILGLLMRLRQACCHPPLLPDALRPSHAGRIPSAKMELLQEVILQAIDSNRRMLLFSQFTSLLKAVIPWLQEQNIPFEYLDGSTKDRMQRVNRFNQDKSIPIFLISLKAGGTGLNLTGADTVIHYDQWWNPMVEDQATDRTHRIGQTNTVISMKLVARHTLEEKILQLQEEKRELFNLLLGGVPAKVSELSPEDFEFLLQ